MTFLSSCLTLDIAPATTTPLPSDTPTPTATIIWFPPSATPTAIAVPTFTGTPVMSPRVGRQTLSDDFSDDALWDTAKGDGGSAAITMDRLSLAVQPGYYISSMRRDLPLSDATAFEAIAGHGIRATVDNRIILVGNRKLMADQGIDVQALEAPAAALAQAGKTPMFAALDGQAAGLLAVADPIKPSARAAVEGLQARGIETVMITGDNRRTAEAVAAQLGIGRVFAEVLPADKARYV